MFISLGFYVSVFGLYHILTRGAPYICSLGFYVYVFTHMSHLPVEHCLGVYVYEYRYVLTSYIHHTQIVGI